MVPIPILPVLKVVPAPSMLVPKRRLPMLRVLALVAEGASMSKPRTMLLEPVERLSPA